MSHTGSCCMLYYVTHWQLLYAVLCHTLAVTVCCIMSHTALPPHVQDMSQCVSHNSHVLTVVRLTTNHFWQQHETYNNTIINLSSHLVYTIIIIIIISSTALGGPWPPQYTQCKAKCKTTWSFLSVTTFRFPTPAIRQHPQFNDSYRWTHL
jgi:hypothetical protein